MLRQNYSFFTTGKDVRQSTRNMSEKISYSIQSEVRGKTRGYFLENSPNCFGAGTGRYMNRKMYRFSRVRTISLNRSNEESVSRNKNEAIATLKRA